MRAWPLLIVALALPARAQIPDNGHLAWASNRADGRHEVFVRHTDAPAVRMTFEGGEVPRWSPDGQWVAYFHPADRGMHLMRPDGSDDHFLCQAAPIKDALAAFWLHDGTGLVCVHKTTTAQGFDVEYTRFDPDTGEDELLFRQNEFPHLVGWRFEPGGITHDNALLVGWAVGLFRNGHAAENGTFATEHATVILDLADRQRIYFLGSGCLSATAPTGDWLYHVSRETPFPPDIARMRASDMMTRDSYALELGLDDDEWGHEYMPDISNDGQYLVYSASLGCHSWFTCDYEVFVHRVGDDATARTRLTEDPGNDNFPSLFVGQPWSPEVEAEHEADAGADAPDAEAETSEPAVEHPARDDGSGCAIAGGQGFTLALLLLAGLRRSHQSVVNCAVGRRNHE